MAEPIKLTDEVLDRIIVSMPDSNGLLRIDMTVVDAIRALRDAAHDLAVETSRNPNMMTVAMVNAHGVLCDLLPDSEVEP